MEEVLPGYIRVTDILNPLSDLSMIPKPVLENKRMIGTEVHDAIDLYNCGFPCTLSPEAQPYFDSFLRWESDTKMVPIQSEKRYYDDKLMITGKIDSVVRVPEEKGLVLCDWKTSASYTKDMQFSWMLQGTFYHYLLEEANELDLSLKFFFVQLNKYGKKPRVRVFEYTEENMTYCRGLVRYHKCIAVPHTPVPSVGTTPTAGKTSFCGALKQLFHSLAEWGYSLNIN